VLGRAEAPIKTDSLIRQRAPLPNDLERVLQNPDLVRVVLAHLALVDGSCAARTCRLWRTAWYAHVPARKVLGRAEWYTDAPIDYNRFENEQHTTPSAMGADNGTLVFFSETNTQPLLFTPNAVAAVAADNLRLDEGHSHSRYFVAKPGSVVTCPAYEAPHGPVDVVITATAVYVLTSWELQKLERGTGEEWLSAMSRAATMNGGSMMQAATGRDFGPLSQSAPLYGGLPPGVCLVPTQPVTGPIVLKKPIPLQLGLERRALLCAAALLLAAGRGHPAGHSLSLA